MKFIYSDCDHTYDSHNLKCYKVLKRYMLCKFLYNLY